MLFKQSIGKFALSAAIVWFNAAAFMGLRTFYYNRKHKSFRDCRLLHIYCRLMGVLFFVLYPISIVVYMEDFKDQKLGVTDYARISTYIGSWLLNTAIIYNQPKSSCAIYNRAKVLYESVMSNEHAAADNANFNNVNCVTKCLLKTAMLAVGFLIVNIQKFAFRMESKLDPFGWILLTYLFLPNFITTITSHEFYVAATFCLFIVTRNNEQVEAIDGSVSSCQAQRLKISSRNYVELHELFRQFNGVYAKYILCILGFCFFNVVYEVSKCICLSLSRLFLAPCFSSTLFSSTFQWQSRWRFQLIRFLRVSQSPKRCCTFPKSTQQSTFTINCTTRPKSVQRFSIGYQMVNRPGTWKSIRFSCFTDNSQCLFAACFTSTTHFSIP